MKISVIGTHGTGKTTLTYLLAAYAKKLGKNARVINETARSCPFPLNEGFSIDGAYWIVTTQIQKELSAKAAKTEYIICDRASIDPVMYLDAGSFKHDAYEDLRSFAENWMKTYDLLIWIHPEDRPLSYDGIRSTDITFQQNVHNAFCNWIKKNKFEKNLITIDASVVFNEKLHNLFHEVFHDQLS